MIATDPAFRTALDGLELLAQIIHPELVAPDETAPPRALTVEL